REGEEEIDIEIEGENLAYVIYTSGSTGSPKGVMNTHRGITNRLLWMQERYQLNCEDRVLQKTPLSFDVSVWELFWPLIVGARLVMAKPGGHKDTDYLVKTIAGRGITTIHFVPSMLQAFLEEENLDTCKSLKRVICSGEVLSPRLQNRFFACMAAELHNLYGPTEAAIDVTFWQCDREDKRRTVPIGKPITNTEILLLCPDLNLVPTGVAGQLHIGGQGVARGYLNRPDLTAEKFIPDAFGKEPGARIYDTGDLARLLDDGNIEYLGRSDHQIKLRGYRIEVSEIEQVLMEHPGVKEAVVVLREFGEDDKRLIAYFVTDDRQAPTADELQGFLASRLPEYMMPWTIVRLESLPLTTSGKLDRSALPAPADPDSRKNGAPVAPRSPVEEIIASIWSEVLEVEKVGVTDDYFALGGHSLKATRIMSRLRKAFQVELPLSVLFERPTVAGLAEEITLASHSIRASEIPPIEHISRDGGIPLSFAQQRIWMLDQLNPGNPVYNILLAVELTGILKAEALERSINEIIRRHEVLRTRFETVEGHPVQVIMPQLALELVVEELRAPDASGIEKEIERLTIEEAHKGFDLSTGPLIRARLLSLSGQEHVFLIAMHHIISDGWSQEIFFREMAALYSAFCAGEPSPLPEPPFQYADYAHWQRVWLTDDVMTEQIDYWRQQLKGIPPPITLSPSRPRPELPGYKGASQSLSLDAEASAPLKALAGREGATMFMVVLAAFKSSLYCHTGQEDIVVGTNFANRNRVEIEGLIGLFLNQAVLRTDLSGNPTFRQILRRVREAVLGAILHEELPFEQVIDELRIKRDLSQGLLFQIKVDYQQISFSPPDIADLILTPMNIDTGMAKFDLSVLMVDAYDGFSISFVYNRELFEEETILEMLDGFERVLKIVGANSDQTLNQLARLVEQEQRKQRIQKRRERKAATLRSLKTIKRRRLITPEPAQ
ncbi:MAG: amino acid adenylation domain-containing protein, partial [Blastocatellia bacterium]|nr:amino acid adenylation domain-containing protein [Blastocatellia bacterium]